MAQHDGSGLFPVASRIREIGLKLFRCLCHQVPIEASERQRVCERICEFAAEDVRQRVELEVQAGHDAEIAAAAS